MTGPAGGPAPADPWTGDADLVVRTVAGIGEVTEGTDLAALVSDAALADGDVVVVTSKVVSKAEDRVVRGERPDAVAAETVRVVARRGGTAIVQNRLGLVMAAAGVDASNVEPGSLVLLPEDPDASARHIRDGVRERTDRNIAVLVSDTAGRPWREGQTDIAIGVAGLVPLDDHAGRVDGYGNPLAVTAPAVADELCGLAEVASGKLSGRPVVIIRGLADRVLPPGEHGPGAGALQRPLERDMFGLGTREAVVAAVAGDVADAFGAPAAPDDVVRALQRCGFAADLAADLDADARSDVDDDVTREPADTGVPADVPADVPAEVIVHTSPDDVRLAVLLHALRWQVAGAGTGGGASGASTTRLVPLP